VAEQRLERARLFLWKRQMNVTEAAFAVGYSSLSHFAKIFRARFGVNPHEYLAQSENSLDLAPVATGSGGRAV
jgi:AraC-like DNA-binding protein